MREKEGKLKLEKTLLVNWLYYDDELIEYGKNSTLITGGTGCGKSALADAVMLVQLGKITGFMNKAGNENNDRTLLSYMVGNHMGGDKRKNNPFSSCIFNQWMDTESGKRFLLGMVSDYTPGKNMAAPPRQWFVVRDYAIPDCHFLKQDRVMRTIAEVKDFIRTDLLSQGNGQDGDNLLCPKTNNEYCKERNLVMGELADDRYFQILEKAYTFRSSDVNYLTSFIGKFLFPSYLLERESQLEKEKQTLANLEQQETQYRSILILEEKIKTAIRDRQKAEAARKEADAAAYDETEALMRKWERDENACETNIEKGMGEKEQNESESRGIKEKMVQLQEKKETYIGLNASGDALRRSQLAKERERLLSSLQEARDAAAKGEASLKALASSLLASVRQVEEAQTDVLVDTKMPRGIISLLLDPSRYGVLAGADADEKIGQYWISLGARIEALTVQKRESEKDVADITKEVETLEKGIKRYPQCLIDFLSLVRPFAPEASILSDSIDFVPGDGNEPWRIAVERALGDSRFAVLVDGDHFAKVFGLYQSFLMTANKGSSSLHLPFSIVDASSLKECPCDPSSLASCIMKQEGNAYRYAVSLLSSYSKEETVSLPLPCGKTTTRKGVASDSVSIGTLGKIDDCYIGRHALEIQMEAAKRRLREAETERKRVSALLSLFVSAKAPLASYRHGDVSIYIESYNRKRDIDGLDHRQQELKKEIESILVPDYPGMIEEINRAYGDLSVQNDKLQARKGMVEQQLQTLGNNLEKAKEERQRQETLLKTLSCDPILAAELKKQNRGSFAEQAQYFHDMRNRKDEESKSSRRVFDKSYRDYMSACDQYHSQPSRSEEDLEDTLRLYEKQCELFDLQGDSVKKARDQIVKLFCVTMGESIHDVEKTIANLNRRLSDERYSFGGERYKFVVNTNTDKLSYKKMFDKFRSTNDSGALFFDSCCDEYKEELDVIRDYLKSERKEKGNRYLDPMEYLNFDIEITNENGRKGNLSTSSGKKSGGESQIPVYISLMALVAESCESKNAIARPGLIILDEAFSKAQGDFSRTLLTLMRQQGLQLVMISPDTTVANYAGRVDEQYVVTKMYDVMKEPVSHCIRYDSGTVEES